MNESSRFEFNLDYISDVYGPDLLVRTYLEHEALRSILKGLPENLNNTAELGAGYGRMTLVLKEFSQNVFAYEREMQLVKIGTRLSPQLHFVQVESLSKLPAKTDFFDLLMTFTCLQHHSNEELDPVLIEATRVLKPHGYLLLCEETDGFFKDNFKPGEFGTISRSPAEYASFLSEFEFLKSVSRPHEPSYPRKNVGAFMLFRKRAASLDY